MAAPLLRAYLAISADGFIARPDGSVDWLHDYDPAEFGYADFSAGIGTVVMGRTTFETVRAFGGDWPYAGKHSVVVTSKPLPDPPPSTAARAADFSALAAELRATAGDGDVWLVGGPRLWGGFLQAGALDRLELYVIPRLLGRGIPLLAGDAAGDTALDLLEATTLARGVVRQVYRPLP